MKTKAVYVVVSGSQDVYFEQAWVSAWSLKHHNRGMEVVCVVDEATYTHVMDSHRRGALAVMDRIVRVTTPEGMSPMLRSRWLKTGLRRHVAGDFLFIDTDTVIVAPLTEIDQLDGVLMMVPNGHCRLADSPERDYLERTFRKIFDQPLKGEKYYNSGVIYCRDCADTRRFYDRWFEHWQHSVRRGVAIDQQALQRTQQELGLITEMDGAFNAQVRFSVRYLMTGKILHYFNHMLPLNDATPFYHSGVYEQVKRDGTISPAVERLILQARENYAVQSYIVAGRELEVRNGNAFRLLRLVYERWPRCYRLLDLICKLTCSLIIRFKKC